MDSEAICARHIRRLEPIATGVAPRLNDQHSCAAMLFDVYGTLLISGAGEIGLGEQVDRATTNRLLDLCQRYNIQRTPQELMSALENTVNANHHNRRQRGVAFPEIDIVQIWQTVLGWNDVDRVKAFALETELIVNPVYPMPGMNELLAFCRNRGLRMGIISNAQFYTIVVLEWLFGGTIASQGFDPQLLFFSWQAGHAKPSRFMFARAKEALDADGIAAEAVLYVGNDMRNDILPAASIGFKTALFAGDRRSLRHAGDEQSSQFCPDLVVTELNQLIGVLRLQGVE